MGRLFVPGTLRRGVVALVASCKAANRVQCPLPVAPASLRTHRPGTAILLEVRLGDANPARASTVLAAGELAGVLVERTARGIRAGVVAGQRS